MRISSNVLLVLTITSTALGSSRRPTDIPDSWIVQLREDAIFSVFLAKLYEITEIQPASSFTIGGFQALSLDNVGDDLIGRVLNITDVEHVEPNAIVTTTANYTQPDAPWGLARLSHRDNTVSGGDGIGEYNYDETAGAGTCTYVLDTGIYLSHPEFEGRAIWGENFAGDDVNTDNNGHGTHVAGIIGANTFGVAKATKLIAVKVLDANGESNTTSVLQGIQWAVNDSTSREGCIDTSIINLSLGGLYSLSFNAAVAAAVGQNLFVAVAAGNSGLPEELGSPASTLEACTVGATDIADTRADFSNWGTLVDIFAPGANITSTWSPDSVAAPQTVGVLSGTSQATAHIAGLGAYLMGWDALKANETCKTIQELSTKGVIANVNLSKNYLAYNGIAIN